MKATLRHLRIAPRKVRLVADLVRGQGVLEAQQALRLTRKKAALPLLKLLNSAVANAKQQRPEASEAQLKIRRIVVDEGPKLKRYRARAMGRAAEIQKKTSHITLELEERTGNNQTIPK